MILKLEQFSENHLENTFYWMQNINLKKDFLYEGNVTWDSHLSWFNNYLKDSTQKIWAIICSDKHIGNIGLKNISPNNSAEIWIYIGDTNARGKHIGTKSLENILSQPDFIGLNLQNLYANVAEWNMASRKMFINAGYTQKEILKEKMIFHKEHITLYSFIRFIN